MKVVGLTGGIASGKSTVARFLAELGAVVIDADRLGHEVLKFDPEAWQELVAAFGQGILTPEGHISREKLGELVFGNPELLARLNRIVHPRITERMKFCLENYRRQGVKAVVIEAALLLESGWYKLVDEVWVTVASETTILRRLRERGGLSEPEAYARIRAQLPPEERMKRADVVIDTDCSLDELRTVVGETWRRLNYPEPSQSLTHDHGN
jgi:dephospho-CoA kinase